MSKEHIYQQVKNLVAENKLEQAFKLLFDHLDNHQLIVQSGSYRSLKSDIQSGVLTYEHAQIEKNRIRQAILAIARDTQLEYTSARGEKIIKKLKLFVDIFIKRKKKFFPYLLFLGMIYSKQIRAVLIALSLAALVFLGGSYLIRFEKIPEGAVSSVALAEVPQLTVDSLARCNDIVARLQLQIVSLQAAVDSMQILTNQPASIDNPSEALQKRIDRMKQNADDILTALGDIKGVTNYDEVDPRRDRLNRSEYQSFRSNMQTIERKANDIKSEN